MQNLKRIVLHVGLPKTGSSALQSWGYENRGLLRSIGVDYPEPPGNTLHPKHQQLVSWLASNQLDGLDSFLKTDCRTLFLSSEGLTNHLYDFSSEALETFRRKTSAFELTVFLVCRDRDRWLRSYYKQTLINRPIAQYNYATALRYEEFIKLPRTLRLANTEKLEADAKQRFGAMYVKRVLNHEEWQTSLLDLLEIDHFHKFTEVRRHNGSVNDDLVELIRQFNGLNATIEERDAFLKLLQNTFETGHSVLKSKAVTANMRPSPINFLYETLDKLQPESGCQSDMVEQMRQHLKIETT